MRHSGSHIAIGLCLAILMLVGGPAASAFGFAKVRLVNARPGSNAVGLKVIVGGAAPPPVGPASYGQVTPYARVSPGSAQISLTGATSSANQLSAPARRRRQLHGDRAREGQKGFKLKLYRDGHAQKGTARLRVIHAAPELGSPNIKLGQRTVAEKRGVLERDALPLRTSQAPTSSRSRSPAAACRSSSTASPLSAGVATTAILAGSGGAPERLITATDDTLTPAGAPETGLGGLAGGGGHPWLLIALAALLAGALGGAVQLAVARRHGRP